MFLLLFCQMTKTKNKCKKQKQNSNLQTYE